MRENTFFDDLFRAKFLISYNLFRAFDHHTYVRYVKNGIFYLVTKCIQKVAKETTLQ